MPMNSHEVAQLEYRCRVQDARDVLKADRPEAALDRAVRAALLKLAKALRTTALAAGLIGAGGYAAHAEDKPIVRTAYVHSMFKGFPKVIIWHDAASSERGMALLAGGSLSDADLLAINALASCIVPNGTPVFMTTTGYAHQDVLVLKGDQEGCTGSIWTAEARAR